MVVVIDRLQAQGSFHKLGFAGQFEAEKGRRHELNKDSGAYLDRHVEIDRT